MKQEMKLERKHLVGYFPYELMAYGGSDYHKIVGLDFNNIILENPIGTFVVSYEDFSIDYDLALRPLSDLTKKMDAINVEYIDYLWHHIIWTNRDSFNKSDFYENCELGNIDYLPIMVYQKLLEWKFDVFNLIPNGLAVDINTLNHGKN